MVALTRWVFKHQTQCHNSTSSPAVPSHGQAAQSYPVLSMAVPESPQHPCARSRWVSGSAHHRLQPSLARHSRIRGAAPHTRRQAASLGQKDSVCGTMDMHGPP